MASHKSARRAFTILEILIVAGISIAIGIVMVASLAGRRNRADLDNTTKEIAALLREAQSRSVAQEGGSVWGVHFDNNTSTPFFSLFKGSSYGTSSEVKRYRLPPTVQFSSSSVAQGGALDITFNQISGEPSTSTSISLNQTAGGTSAAPENVSRTGSGKIFFDDFNRTNL
jgi:type II secretory pathway pseudopilin PulG